MSTNNTQILPSITAEDWMNLGSIKHLAAENNLKGFNQDFIPPRFTDPNYVMPDKGNVLFVLNIVMVSIVFVVVALRYYARVFIAGGLGADDVAIGFAVLSFIGSCSLYCFSVKTGGFGRHIYDLDSETICNLLKETYIMPILYNVGVFFIKLSLLLFYRRLFGPNRLLQRLVIIFIIFQVIYTVGSTGGLIFICSPVYAWWYVSLRATKCPDFIKTMTIFLSLRAVSVFTDVLVLLLPMKMLWDLKIPVRQKLGLGVVFGLGIMACVTATLRLAYLPRLLTTVDVSWHVIPVAICDVLEQSLGIITASLPALTAIIAKFRGSVKPARKCPGTNNPDSACESTTSFIGRTKPECLLPTHGRIDSVGNFGHNASAREINTPSPPEFDFLSVAYDPDNVNMGFAVRSWVTGPERKSGGWWRRVRGDSSEENLVRGFDGISKTTTVEMKVDRRIV
ncbi:hypothetical protein DFP73DRAFT_543950 [Morchella snyderi]|nr:hypothetical protein DFP73DRAFT_543950 [Morchella snyderi]